MSVEAAVILTAGALYLLTRDAPGMRSGVASDAAKADATDALAAERGPSVGEHTPANDLAIVPGAFTPSADGTTNRTAEMPGAFDVPLPVDWGNYDVPLPAGYGEPSRADDIERVIGNALELWGGFWQKFGGRNAPPIFLTEEQRQSLLHGQTRGSA